MKERKDVSTLAIWIWTGVWLLFGGIGGMATMMSPMIFDDPGTKPTKAKVMTVFWGIALWPMSALFCGVVAWLCHLKVFGWEGYAVLFYIPFAFMASALVCVVFAFRKPKTG